MAARVAVVLKNSLLNELCGANDKNLKTLEELLGVSIYSRGNEIFLETEDEELKFAFRSIITQLEDYVRLGQHPGPDLVRAIFHTINGGGSSDTDLLRESHVYIPKSNIRIFPKSYNQALYLDGIEKYEMVFGIGPAGTGKTYLAIAHAIKAILSRSKRKLILTRPVVEVGESLGYLPGDLEQKISPYLRPLYDAMEALIPFESIRSMEENRVIEIAPLGYMRGRTLADAFVILDEAQNTTKEQMMMFLTRIGEGSKAVITGDITQIDLPKKEDSGLLHAISVLNSIQRIRFIFFSEKDVVRNSLVREIVRAYENETEKK